MTMTNAEWMIKNGNNFRSLDVITICRDDIVKVSGIRFKCNVIDKITTPAFVSDMLIILRWLNAEHVEPILDDAEKRYLSAVIRPFRDDVQYIVKYAGKFSSRAYEEISIRYQDKMCEDKYSFSLPRFDKGTMYKGMEVNRHYTLRELGL